MRTLAEQLLTRYGGRRFGAMARVLNERAALYDGLFESSIEGQPYVGFNAVVLTADERDRLVYLTEIFNTIMTKAMTAVVQESSAVLRSLGWPENLEYYLRHEPVNRFLTPIGRFDFALDTDGEWRLMEFNSDTPSGAQEVTLVEERQWPHLARLEPGRLARLNPAIASQLTQALYDESLFAPGPPEVVTGPFRPPLVGFLVQGRYLTDLAQVSYYARTLGERGLDCVVGDISNFNLLGGQFYLLGQPIDALYRLFPVERLSLEPIFVGYLQATCNVWLKSLNNLRGFLAQSKAILAWVWQHRDAPLFTVEEQAVITCHLPPTFLLEDLPADFDYTGYIIKEFYGREGAEVYNGATLNRASWEQCRAWRTFVAQQRISIAPTTHLLPTPDWSAASQLEVFPCVGSYIIGGRSGGCYTRLGDRITNSYAQFVPTLVERLVGG